MLKSTSWSRSRPWLLRCWSVCPARPLPPPCLPPPSPPLPQLGGRRAANGRRGEERRHTAAVGREEWEAVLQEALQGEARGVGARLGRSLRYTCRSTSLPWKSCRGNQRRQRLQPPRQPAPTSRDDRMVAQSLPPALPSSWSAPVATAPPSSPSSSKIPTSRGRRSPKKKKKKPMVPTIPSWDAGAGRAEAPRRRRRRRGGRRSRDA